MYFTYLHPLFRLIPYWNRRVFSDGAYTKSQTSSLALLRKAITVTNMPAAELQKMKDLARKGVWEKMKNDPQKGPLVKLLAEDVARFTKK